MLMWMNRKMRKNKKGFTLIELIVVIAILAILALIAIPRFSGFTLASKGAADESSASTIAKAVNIYTSQMTNAEKLAFGVLADAAQITALVTAELIETNATTPQVDPTKAFLITYDAGSGATQVLVETHVLYPKTDTAYDGDWYLAYK